VKSLPILWKKQLPLQPPAWHPSHTLVTRSFPFLLVQRKRAIGRRERMSRYLQTLATTGQGDVETKEGTIAPGQTGGVAREVDQ